MNEEKISKLETLHNKIYKETEEYGRTQFVSRIVDLEHNWNELKKWLEEYFKRITIEDIPKDDFYKKGMYRMNEYTLDKIKELEEGGNNDC